MKRWLASLLLICISLSANTGGLNKCVDTTGRVTYTDEHCAAGSAAQKMRPSLDDGANCPSRKPREYHGPGVVDPRVYKLPQEATELRCEIAFTKSMIALHQSRMKELTSDGAKRTYGVTKSGRAALAQMYYAHRAFLSSEQQHLSQLEQQFSLGPAYVERQQRIREWSERCNHVTLGRVEDEVARARCEADGKLLFGK